MIPVSEDGFYVATRKVNPILAEFFDFLYKTYGSNVLKKPRDFMYIDDVAVTVQLERLRDDLAVNLITREDFVNEMYKLLEKYINISPEVYQLLNKLHVALSGRPLLLFPHKDSRAFTSQISRLVEAHRIDVKRQALLEGWDFSSTRGEARTVLSQPLTRKERYCPICKGELYFLQYVGKYYCFNCKKYLD